MTKKKKHILQLDIEFDFAIIGISSHQKDFKLCWSLNTYCGTNFKKEDDLQVEIKTSTSKIPFSFFSYINKEVGYEMLLIENRSQGHFLLPEFKAVDYLLFLKGSYNKEIIKQLVNELKNNPFIITAFAIDEYRIVNKQHLYFLL